MSCPEPTSSWFVQRDTSTRRWTTHREKTEKSFQLPDLHSKHEWSFMTISDIWHQQRSNSSLWGLKLYRLFGSPQNTQCILTTEELMILESTTKAAAAFGFSRHCSWNLVEKRNDTQFQLFGCYCKRDAQSLIDWNKWYGQIFPGEFPES